MSYGEPAKRKEYARRYFRKLKAEVLAHYNPDGKPICSTCGFENLTALTLSHLARTELEFRPGTAMYLGLRKQGYPKLPLLTECLNCNVIRDNWGHDL